MMINAQHLRFVKMDAAWTLAIMLVEPTANVKLLEEMQPALVYPVLREVE